MDQPDKKFPLNRAFLKQMQALADKASNFADAEILESGGKAGPAALDGLGRLLVFVFGLATCGWGCKGGNHQIEWLLGRVLNQAFSAHRLMRSGFYDEALVLIRGIGEIANLLLLFQRDKAALAEWKTCDRKTRLRKFGPGAVRETLEKLGMAPAMITKDRYEALCEIGAHPVPAFKPGHYSGGGPPVLGVLFQVPGFLVCLNELGFAVAMCAVPAATLMNIDKELREIVVDLACDLLRSLGSMTVLNYEEYIANAKAGKSPPSEAAE
jgi:hypothetical protein